MAQDRKEPTFSSIKPERDEIATHQNPGQRPANGGGSKPRPQGARPSAPSAKSGLAVVAFLVAIIGVAAGGFGIWKMQQADQYMADAEKRIVELEARLNLTNNESDQSVSAIHDKLEWADSEIRKLWGVANDTNRKAIAANKDLASQAASNAKSAKDNSDVLQAVVTAAKTRINEQQLTINQLSEDMSQARTQLKQVNELTDKLESSVNGLGDIQSRVKTNEEAIRAIDAFRRTANTDIQELKQRLAPQ